MDHGKEDLHYLLTHEQKTSENISCRGTRSKDPVKEENLLPGFGHLVSFFSSRLIHPLPGQFSDTSAWYFLTSLAVAADASQIRPVRDG